MRKINKQSSLEGFNGNKFKDDCSDWNCFHDKYHDDYELAISQILVEEQDSLCGYTELYIADSDNKKHIDHYRKKSSSFFPNLVFEWNNLIGAIKNSEFGADYKDNKCHGRNRGIIKSEYSEIYNPVEDNIPFKYTSWGEIIEDKGKIKKTIEIFNLNHESLKRRRQDILDTIDALKRDGENFEDIKISLQDAGFTSVIEQALRDL